MYDKKFPLLISYPRSGSHWINAMGELYFDRPRGPTQNGGWTYRPKNKGEDFMWYHSHDEKDNISTSVSKEGDIFLYRNPLNTIYSLLQIPTKHSAGSAAHYYKILFEKWISLAKTILVYEEIVENPLICLKIMSKHFNIEFDHEKAKTVIKKCTRDNMFNDFPQTKFHNKNLLSSVYAENRKNFTKKHYHVIKDTVLTEKTKPFLLRYFDKQ